MKRQAAFTLIELLIVIGILGILVTILVPVVGTQIEKARQRSCGANLRAIGTKMREYANTNRGRFPRAASVLDATPSGTTEWTGKTGVYRTTAPDDTTHTSVTATQWLLVRDQYVDIAVEAFICPSTGEAADDFTDSGDVQRPVSELYDFKSRANISYSFYMPYGNTTLSLASRSDIAIGADKSPFYDNATGALVGGITPAANNSTNSSNNHIQEGQNVLFTDGRVDWFKYANAGTVGDNIYTRYWSGGTGDETNAQIGIVGDNLVIKEDDDSFLAP